MKVVPKKAEFYAIFTDVLPVILPWLSGLVIWFLLIGQTTGENQGLILKALSKKSNWFLMMLRSLMPLIAVYCLAFFQKRRYIYLLLSIKAFLHFYVLFALISTIGSGSWLFVPLILFSENISNGLLLYCSWFGAKPGTVFSAKLLYCAMGISVLAILLDCFLISRFTAILF